MQVCVDVFGCCEMYKCSLVAFNTQARNKAKEEREREKKKRLAATCQPLSCLGLTKGLAEHYTVYWHQVSLHPAGVGWGFGTVIFKVHPFSFF